MIEKATFDHFDERLKTERVMTREVIEYMLDKINEIIEELNRLSEKDKMKLF